ncbi:MAG: lipase family protein [Stellaceae bacterium]
MQLSALAYVDENTNASRQQMIDAIDSGLNSAGHQDWTVVWGPALDPGRSNMMYVAGNNAGSQFAVAVRGTDWKFWLDWIEDFDNFLPLTQYSRFGVPVGPNVKIAQGTAVGLEVLLSLADGAADLKTFITAKAQHAQILVTGHSLGGCLAAALAPCIATWVGAANISVYTFATPSPGNSDFADYYNGLFVAPTSTKPSTAFRFYNSLDVVPNAWATLPTIETYYPPQLPCPSDLRAAVNYAAGKVGSEYAQLGTSSNGSAVSLPGSFIDPLNFGQARAAISPIGDTLFLLEAGQQHLTTTYQRLLGVPMVSAAAAVLKRLAAKVRADSAPTPIPTGRAANDGEV